MREKSQLDDMRAAIRGDLERAKARREADPWREPEAEPEPEPIESLRSEVSETPALEPEPEPELPFAPESVAVEPEPDQSEPAPSSEEEPEPKKPGFFSSLFGR